MKSWRSTSTRGVSFHQTNPTQKPSQMRPSRSTESGKAAAMNMRKETPSSSGQKSRICCMKIALGGVPTGVAMPPAVAEKAMASRNAAWKLPCPSRGTAQRRRRVGDPKGQEPRRDHEAQDQGLDALPHGRGNHDAQPLVQAPPHDGEAEELTDDQDDRRAAEEDARQLGRARNVQKGVKRQRHQ
eukprot:scaffold50694_cov62-Phaeocystis_antarctica.AAC.3